jgi:AcrR family transcriptional regulator
MAMTKRERLAEFNREQIISAAKSLFETRGIFGTTVDDIALKADCSKSTLYVYFKGKNEIYHHILCEGLVLLRDRLKAAVRKKTDFEESFYAVCRALTEFQREYPLYFEGFMNGISTDEDDFERSPVLRDIYVLSEELNVIMSEIILKGMEADKLRPELDPMTTIFMLWASLCGIIRMAGQKEKYFRDKFRLKKQKYLDYSFRMLLNAIKA